MDHTLTLSFDKGPEKTVLGEVLDVLSAHEFRMMIFLISEKLARREPWPSTQVRMAIG